MWKIVKAPNSNKRTTCKQVSRLAIRAIKFTARQLTPGQLEKVARTLLFGLMSRVGGDTSTAFLRNDACEAISELVECVPTLKTLCCLNDACYGIPARSLNGRRCLVRCYAMVLPRLFTSKSCRASSSFTRKHQEVFDRMLHCLAMFLRDGDVETRLLESFVITYFKRSLLLQATVTQESMQYL